MADKPIPRYASYEDAAHYIAVKPRTVRAMVGDGRLTAHRLGERVVRLDLNEVDAAMSVAANRRYATEEERIGEWADRMLAEAPPLSDEQRTKLAELLRPIREHHRHAGGDAA